ncbi:MAG: hypothetical protein JSV89_21355 [Spirochaetaceae bacterium]|nr:MAG: hypothetical protein JSV89_21355 [Spirochaetaceae bacterium]
MKRAARTIVMKLFLLLILWAAFDPRTALAEAQDTAGVLLWANRLRSLRGLSQLGADPLLEHTAALYAADLADRGVLTHLDEKGRRALQRFRAQGGTAVLVGEILGSGAQLSSLTSAWEGSQAHREVVFNPLWTHCGASAVAFGETRVWVVLFTSHRIDQLQILLSANGYLIRGRLNTAEAEEPVLFSGIEILDPQAWDSLSREFSYLIPLDRADLFHRLGYRTREDGLMVTDTFYPVRVVTSDRGREHR